MKEFTIVNRQIQSLSQIMAEVIDTELEWDLAMAVADLTEQLDKIALVLQKQARAIAKSYENGASPLVEGHPKWVPFNEAVNKLLEKESKIDAELISMPLPLKLPTNGKISARRLLVSRMTGLIAFVVEQTEADDG